jgi:hypothetical protein
MQTYNIISVFYNCEICHRKLNVTLSGFIMHFILLWYIDCILVARQPGNGHGGDWTMLVKCDSMWLSIFIIAHLVVYYVSKQHSLTL